MDCAELELSFESYRGFTVEEVPWWFEMTIYKMAMKYPRSIGMWIPIEEKDEAREMPHEIEEEEAIMEEGNFGNPNYSLANYCVLR